MTAAPPASATEALEMLTSAMSYLATADPTQMPAEIQARCLAGLELDVVPRDRRRAG